MGTIYPVKSLSGTFVCTYCRRVYDGEKAPSRCEGCGASAFAGRRIVYIDVSKLPLSETRQVVQEYRKRL
jgi:hypothetical protein